MHCCEARNIDLLTLHVANRERFTLAELDACIFPRFDAGFRMCDVLRCISEYTARSLTYQSDILNGILGIFRAFENSILKEEKNEFAEQCSKETSAAILPNFKELRAWTGPPRVAEDLVRHYWGVPVFPAGITFRRSLDGFICGLFWTLVSPGNRRPGFPSWSWTGWIGKVEWRAIDIALLRKWTCKEILHDTWGLCDGVKVGIRIETSDGCLLDWKTFDTSNVRNKPLREFSRFIHIEAFTVPIWLTLKSDQPEPSRPAEIEVQYYCEQQEWLAFGIMDQLSRNL
jgi:hypothetical protein